MPQVLEAEPPGSENFAAICAVLWSERQLLEALRQQADAQRAMTDRLRLQEVLRAAMVEALREVTGEPVPATLAALAAVAPEPWATILTDHCEALRALLADVGSVAGVSQRSLADFLA